MPKHITALVLAPAYVLLAFWLLSWVLAKASGWRRLVSSYANDSPFEITRWQPVQATFRNRIPLNTNLTLRLGVDRQYLYLRTWPFSFPGFAELRVAWQDVAVEEGKVAIWKFCRLRFREQPQIEIRLPVKAMQSVLNGVGATWTGSRLEFPA